MNKLIKIILIVFGLFFAIGIFRAILNPTDNSIKQEVVQEVPKEYAVLSGIEDGELMVEEINLWENPGPDRGKVVGKIGHDTEVEILNEVETNQLYYQVKSKNLTGWVSKMFITDIYSK